ncbi:MAG: LOG family protein, partial [Campylobacter sp.]
MNEILKDFKKFPKILDYANKSVTFFGSARFNEDNEYCKAAHDLAFMLGERGFAVVTGGGDGIMRAANRGAFESGKAPSVALNIRLP